MKLKHVALLILFCGFAHFLRADDEVVMLPPFGVNETPWNPGYNYDPNDPLSWGYVPPSQPPPPEEPYIDASSITITTYSGPQPNPNYPPRVVPPGSDEVVTNRLQVARDYVNASNNSENSLNLRGPGEPGTLDDIKRSATAVALHMAEATGFAWEWAAKIYQDKNNPDVYYYGTPVTDRNLEKVDPWGSKWPDDLTNPGITSIGFVHTHPDLKYVGGSEQIWPDQFSGDDKSFVDGTRGNTAHWQFSGVASVTPDGTPYSSWYTGGTPPPPAPFNPGG